MRFSPTKLLHGLLYSTPVLLLTLAACGGGGGSTMTPAPAGPFTIGGSITGLTSASGGLVLRNNGGDDLIVASGAIASYTFATSVANGGSYNVTVLTHPTSPNQVCSVTGGSGSASANITNANVNCVDAYTISGTITGASGVVSIGPILQNNGGDNLFISQITDIPTNFLFSTPVADGATYLVTQLSRPRAQSQDCTVTHADNFIASGVVATAPVVLTITCASSAIADPKFAYVTNSADNTVSAYAIDPASGVLAAATPPTAPTGTNPYSVTVDPSGQFAYVANSNADTVSAYSIDSGSGALTAVASIATGDFPISVTVHPSGKFAYTVNQGVGATGNTISAYSINTNTGALSAMDADGTTGTQATIATGTLPYAITVDPTGKFAYVANYTSNTISAYTINPITGALTSVGTASGTTGTGPSSIAIDPTGKCALVANNNSNNVESYIIDSATGVLAVVTTTTVVPGRAPRSIAVDPASGLYAYVANAGSGDVSAFSVDSSTCAIASISADAAGPSTIAAGTTPFSVNVDPSGQFVYVANFGSTDLQGAVITNGSVMVYSINSGTGALTFVETAPTVVGTTISSVTTTQ